MRVLYIDDSSTYIPFSVKELWSRGVYVDLRHSKLEPEHRHSLGTTFDLIVSRIAVKPLLSWNQSQRQQSDLGIYAGPMIVRELRDIFPEVPVVFYDELAHDRVRPRVAELFGSDDFTLITKGRQTIAEDVSRMLELINSTVPST